MWEKHCPVILPLFLQVILLCFCLFHFVAFLAVTLFGGLGKEKIKKASFPDSQSFVSVKCNTMKNTMQRCVFLRWFESLEIKKRVLWGGVGGGGFA